MSTVDSPRVHELVLAQSNAREGNQLLAYRRAADGQLAPAGVHPTGGTGDGAAHLPSQGSVVLAGDDAHVLVTNAGSGDVSVFMVDADGALALAATVPTGPAPKSVAERAGLVYVLNTGNASVTGFRLDPSGLIPLEGSTRHLAEGADPAQVGFSPDGGTLLVTDRAANALVAFPVQASGALGDPSTVASSGPTPYGFAFTPSGTLVVTEAFGAQRGKAAASSYRLAGTSPAPVSRSVGNGRSEICWAVATRDGRYVFTTNFADGAVSRYAVSADGALELQDATAGLAVDGSAGLRDAALSGDGRFLYAIDADTQQIYGWSLDGLGALTPLGSWPGATATLAGLAVG